MPVLRAALGDHQIVPAVDLIQVRSLRTLAARAVPDDLRLTEPRAGLEINRKHTDAGSSVFVRMCARVVRRAVIVPEQRGVDAQMVNVNRV